MKIIEKYNTFLSGLAIGTIASILVIILTVKLQSRRVEKTTIESTDNINVELRKVCKLLEETGIK